MVSPTDKHLLSGVCSFWDSDELADGFLPWNKLLSSYDEGALIWGKLLLCDSIQYSDRRLSFTIFGYYIW